jgi:tetratricopeptide (TPR) repeat protein
MSSLRRFAAGIAISAILIALTLRFGPAFAVGGGGGNSGGSTGGARDRNTCRTGLVWDARKHMCVQAERGVLPDEDLTEYAYALAEEGRYEEALATLDLLDDPQTARALNYRGFATRKLGRLDEGIGYYLKSVALDPQYAQVREYLGEAYVAKGRLDLAEQQLAIIETLCGTGCEEYIDLSEAIEQGPDL